MMVPNPLDPAQRRAVEEFRLGDLVAGAAKAVGVTPSKGCGCEKRRAALNRATPKFVGRMLDAVRRYWSHW
jgi:hypothetical protein